MKNPYRELLKDVFSRPTETGRDTPAIFNDAQVKSRKYSVIQFCGYPGDGRAAAREVLEQKVRRLLVERGLPFVSCGFVVSSTYNGQYYRFVLKVSRAGEA